MMYEKLSIDSINPCIRKAGLQEKRPDINPKRIIYDYEMIYSHQGELGIIYDDEVVFVNTPAIIIIPPGIPHQLNLSGIVQAYWVHFDFTEKMDRGELADFIENNQPYSSHLPPTTDNHFIRKQVLLMPNLKLPKCYNVACPKSTKAIFINLIDAYTKKETTWFLQCKSLLCQLLTQTFKHLVQDTTLNASHSTLVAQIKSYLDQFYYRQVTIQELSNQFHYHCDTLNRIFKKELGVTIGQYTQSRRHNKVKRLLIETNFTLETIAEIMGYTDRSHLIKTFKKFEGMTPKQYIKCNGNRP